MQTGTESETAQFCYLATLGKDWPSLLTAEFAVLVGVVPAVVPPVALSARVDAAPVSAGELVLGTGTAELVLAVGTLADAVALGRAGAVVAAGHLVRPTFCGEKKTFTLIVKMYCM